MARLLVHRPHSAELVLGEATITIGRARTCALRLQHPSVARVQGRIERDELGRHVLVDMCHTSRFFVRHVEDGRWIGRDGMSVPLADGDRLAIGYGPPGDELATDVEVVFTYEDEPACARGWPVVADLGFAFLRAGLPPPPVPTSLAARVRELAPGLHATTRFSTPPPTERLLREMGIRREPPPDAWTAERLAEQREDCRDLLVVTTAEDRRLGYFLAFGPLAISLGLRLDAEARACFALVEELLAAASTRAFQSRFSRRDRVVVVAHAGEPGWCCTPSPQPMPRGADHARPQEVLAAALTLVRAMTS